MDELENNLPSGDGDEKKEDVVNDVAGEEGGNIENEWDLDVDFSKSRKKKKKKKELDELVAEKPEETQQTQMENGTNFVDIDFVLFHFFHWKIINH